MESLKKTTSKKLRLALKALKLCTPNFSSPSQNSTKMAGMTLLKPFLNSELSLFKSLKPSTLVLAWEMTSQHLVSGLPFSSILQNSQKRSDCTSHSTEKLFKPTLFRTKLSGMLTNGSPLVSLPLTWPHLQLDQSIQFIQPCLCTKLTHQSTLHLVHLL